MLSLACADTLIKLTPTIVAAGSLATRMLTMLNAAAATSELDSVGLLLLRDLFTVLALILGPCTLPRLHEVRRLLRRPMLKLDPAAEVSPQEDLTGGPVTLMVRPSCP